MPCETNAIDSHQLIPAASSNHKNTREGRPEHLADSETYLQKSAQQPSEHQSSLRIHSYMNGGQNRSIMLLRVACSLAQRRFSGSSASTSPCNTRQLLSAPICAATSGIGKAAKFPRSSSRPLRRPRALWGRRSFLFACLGRFGAGLTSSLRVWLWRGGPVQRPRVFAKHNHSSAPVPSPQKCRTADSITPGQVLAKILNVSMQDLPAPWLSAAFLEVPLRGLPATRGSAPCHCSSTERTSQ